MPCFFIFTLYFLILFRNFALNLCLYLFFDRIDK